MPPPGVDEDMLKALHLACTKGDSGSVAELLSSLPDPTTVGLALSSPDAKGNAAIHLACLGLEHSKASSVVRCLVNTFGDSPERTTRGLSPKSTWGTPLHAASIAGNSDLVSWLLVEKRVDVAAKTVEGVTAMHLACAAGHTNVVKALLKAGADATVKDGDGRATPLVLSVVNGHPALVEWLLTKGDLLKRVPKAELADELVFALASTESPNAIAAARRLIELGGFHKDADVRSLCVLSLTSARPPSRISGSCAGYQARRLLLAELQAKEAAESAKTLAALDLAPQHPPHTSAKSASKSKPEKKQTSEVGDAAVVKPLAAAAWSTTTRAASNATSHSDATPVANASQPQSLQKEAPSPLPQERDTPAANAADALDPLLAAFMEACPLGHLLGVTLGMALGDANELASANDGQLDALIDFHKTQLLRAVNLQVERERRLASLAGVL